MARSGQPARAPPLARQPEGVTEAWFREEIKKYRKVRDQNWQSWNQATAAPSSPLIPREAPPLRAPNPPSAGVSPSTAPLPAKGGLDPIPAVDFWASLRSFLAVRIGEDAAGRVVADFRQRHLKMVDGLSYDDLERLAERRLGPSQ